MPAEEVRVFHGISENAVVSYGAGKSKKVKLQDVEFYFDCVERDRLDSSGRDRRSGELLALRERLLQLPVAEFDATMKTLRNVVTDAQEGDADERRGGGNRRRQAVALFEQVRGAGATQRTTRVDKVAAS